MRVLSIETSCDETGVAIVEGGITSHNGNALVNYSEVSSALNSQAELHAEFGGVYPTLAKREHVSNLVPLLASVLEQAQIPLHSPNNNNEQSVTSHASPLYGLTFEEKVSMAQTWLSHEESILEPLVKLQAHYDPSSIDSIAATIGPGLEPALWVGVNVARTLALFWDKPFIPVNHMEGHIVSAFPSNTEIVYPLLSLLVSGGHTEFVLSTKPGVYEVIGSTRDDAAGEAFDKGARLLGLPYPGGKELSGYASRHRKENLELKNIHSFPRPMITSGNLDMSFSGLKTALLYKLRDLGLNEKNIHSDLLSEISREYEDAIVDVLVSKLFQAIEKTNTATILVAGGVSANTPLREKVQKVCEEASVSLYLPPLSLTGDNAIMIGIAALTEWQKQHTTLDSLSSVKAKGTMPL